MAGSGVYAIKHIRERKERIFSGEEVVCGHASAVSFSAIAGWSVREMLMA
jgi:hypothetical protein